MTNSKTEPLKLSSSEITAAVEEITTQLAQQAGASQRIDCTSESVEQGLARLVLSLIELLRRLLERQAIRRMDANSLSDQQVEEMGQALMKLEQKVHEIAQQFGLRPEELNLDLGPLGNLLDR